MFFINYLLVVTFFLVYLRFAKTGLRKHHDQVAMIQKKIFFNGFMELSYRLWIPLTLSSYLNIEYQYGVDGMLLGDRISDYFGILIFGSVCIAFPCMMIFVALVPADWLE